MFKQGSLSRLLAGVFVVCALALGGIAQMTSTQKAANLANGTRDTFEIGSGIIAGSTSGGGDKFSEAMDIASAKKPATP